MPDLSPEAQKFRDALDKAEHVLEVGNVATYFKRAQTLNTAALLFDQHTSEMRARLEYVQDIVDKYESTQQALGVARERIKELEGGVAHWMSCHSVTAQQLAIAYSTISDLKALCLTDEKVDASAERLRLGLQVGRLRKALEEIRLLSGINDPADAANDAVRIAREALSPAEQEPRKEPRAHICGLSGYNGMIDPPCPGCQDRHGVHGVKQEPRDRIERVLLNATRTFDSWPEWKQDEIRREKCNDTEPR